MIFGLSVIPLSCMVYEDFKNRLVSWYWLVLLFLISVYSGWLVFGSDVLVNSISNFSFLLIVFTVLTLFFSLKEKKFTMIFDVYMGWGDVVLLVAIVPLFQLLDYLIFYTVSSTVALIVGLVLRSKRGVPFAGVISVLLILIFLCGLLSQNTLLLHYKFTALLF